MVCKGRAQGSELRDILRASIVTLSMDAIRARSRSRRVGPFLWPPGEPHIRSNDQGTCAGSSGLASIKRGSTGEDKISIRICWPAGGRAQERRAPTASRPCPDRMHRKRDDRGSQDISQLGALCAPLTNHGVPRSVSTQYALRGSSFLSENPVQGSSDNKSDRAPCSRCRKERPDGKKKQRDQHQRPCAHISRRRTRGRRLPRWRRRGLAACTPWAWARGRDRRLASSRFLCGGLRLAGCFLLLPRLDCSQFRIWKRCRSFARRPANRIRPLSRRGRAAK